jgi:trk system potassium uptake protein TrkA
MNVIIVGCGRVGTELALSLCADHHVSVIDQRSYAFERLGTNFRGRTLQGKALDRDVLVGAGIQTAEALAAVTTSDNTNAVVGKIARDIYHVRHIVARIYNPRRAPLYEKLGLQTVASSSWGAQRIEQLILHPKLQSTYSAGDGEVQIYETVISEDWDGRKLSELVPAGQALPVALARDGQGMLPSEGLVLRTHDNLLISATTEGMTVLRQRLHANGKERR